MRRRGLRHGVGEDGFDLNWASEVTPESLRSALLGGACIGNLVSTSTFVPDPAFWCGRRRAVAAGSSADVLGGGLSGRELFELPSRGQDNESKREVWILIVGAGPVAGRTTLPGC